VVLPAAVRWHVMCWCVGDNGHFYCGQPVLTCSCCDGGVCGPMSGCNCSACKQLDAEVSDMKQHADNTPDDSVSAAELISSWTWGKQPGQCHHSSSSDLVIWPLTSWLQDCMWQPETVCQFQCFWSSPVDDQIDWTQMCSSVCPQKVFRFRYNLVCG